MLKDRAIEAVRWTSASSLVRAGIQLGLLAALARLLDPADFGVMAIVMVVVAYGGLFADAGLSSAVIQRRDLSLAERSSVYWFNLASAMAVGLLTAATAPLIAKLYGDPRLTVLIRMCAPLFVLTAAGRQIEAMAERSIAFRRLSVNEIAAPAIGAAVAISAAALGQGAKSLALGAVASAGTRSLLAWMVLSPAWRPSWHARWSDVRKHWRFGGALTLSNLVNQITMTADVVLGARILGIDLIGLYSAPRQIVHAVLGIINPVVTRVSFPLIAQVQGDRSRVLSAYRETIRMTGGVNAPIYLGLAVLGPELCSLVLGPAWKDSGHVLSALSLAGLLRALVNPVGSLLLGMGRADVAFKWSVASLGVCIPGLFAGALYGIYGLALAAIAIGCVLFVPAWYWLVRPFTGWRFGNYLDITMRAIVLATLAVGCGRWIATLADGAGVRIAITLACSVPGYVLLSARFNPVFMLRVREVLRGRSDVPSN